MTSYTIGNGSNTANINYDAEDDCQILQNPSLMSNTNVYEIV